MTVSDPRPTTVWRRLRSLRLAARAALGAMLGVVAGGTAILFAAWFGFGQIFDAISLLVITLAGLLLGWGAAIVAYALAAVIAVAFSLTVVEPEVVTADAIRLATLVVGAPLIILLLRRADADRTAAVAARDDMRVARDRARATSRALEAARAELHDALERAERERARLEEVAEAIPEPLIVYDAELRGTYGNRAALRLFGRSFVERPLDEWGELVDPRDERGVALPREEWPQVSAQAAPLRRRLTVRLPMAARDVIVDVEGTPIPGGGCVLLLRDVGKEEDQRRRLSRFASFVAHELRNPLAVAKARAELAMRDPDLPARVANHARRGLESVDAAIAILERLELYSRADTGRIEARREAFDVTDALRGALEQLRARGSEREIDISVPRDLRASGDAQLSLQAIANLLINADRYSQPGARVTVTASDGEQVKLRVTDGGPGIADEIADRLFRDRVAAGRGLGLGLYLVHATMAAQGGSVELEQRRPQAVFVLSWPRPDGEPSR